MSSLAVPDNAPIHPDDELLVAYLDGELSREEQTEVENRLVEEEPLRVRLQQLQTGWDLLEDLPEPSTSLKLVESTLEMVVADLVQTPAASQSKWKRHRHAIGIAGLCLAGVIAACAFVYLQRSRDYQRQLKELAIAENMDAFTYGSNLELMRLLAANAEWLKMKNTLEEMGNIRIKPIAGLAAVPLDEREEFLEQLPPESLNQLNARWERFNRLEDVRREQLRRTAQAVAKAPDSELLLQTMQAYGIWLQMLPTDLRTAIESTDPKVRRDAVKAAIANTQVWISRNSSLNLEDDTIDTIYIALQHILRNRISSERFKIPEAFERFQDPEWFAIAMMVDHDRRRSGRGPRPSSGPGAPGGFSRPEPLDSDELNMFLYVLPNSAIADLELIAGGDPLLESMTLQTWAEEAVKRKAPFDRDESTLLQRYQSLDEMDRNRIDLLPPEEFLGELSRIGRSRGRFGSP